MSEPLNGKLLSPRPRDLPPEILRRLPHEDWLRHFAKSLMMGREKRNAPVTPFLLGAITHLERAAQYIALIRNDVHWLTKDNEGLRKQVEALGGIPLPAFRGAPAPGDTIPAHAGDDDPEK